MSTNNFFTSDLPRIHNIVQNSMMVYPKELIISVLRDYFSKDSYYHYSNDEWGFPNVTDHTDLPPGADIPYGINAQPEESLTSELSTRIYIGESYRNNIIHYPSILVKLSSAKSVQVSLNRDYGSIQYENVNYYDGYGNSTINKRAVALITNGAWEGQLSIEVLTRSLRARDDLAELISICLTDIYFEQLTDVGLIIKPISISGLSESDDRNDKLFKLNISCDFRTEWRREIPIKNTLDRIIFSVIFGNENSEDFNITNINSILDLTNFT